MKVVFPYSLKDQEQAVRLAAWICELSPDLRRHSVLIVHDARCALDSVAAIQGSLSSTFGTVESIAIADDAYDSWPHSCNLMFRRAGKHIELGPNPEPWLWLEPDAIPLRPDWLDTIEAEYKTAGKPFMGDRVEVADVPLHQSGVGVYPATLSNHGGLAYLALEIAWDVFAAEQIVPQSHFTKLIEHSWKRDHVTKENLLVTFDSLDQVEREISPEAVIYHASKDGSLIERLRERKIALSVGGFTAGKPGPARSDLISSSGGIVPEVGSGNDYPTRNDEQAGCGSRESGHNVNGLGARSSTCDILIKSYPPDYERLRYCLRAIDKFASGFRRVVVVIPDDPEVIGFGMGMSNPDCRTVRVPESGCGYLFQNACKANAHEYSDADFILFIDSDTVLTRPVTPETFMRDGKPLWLITPYAHLEAGIAELSRANAGFHCGVMTWKAITEKFIGQPVEYEFMRRFPMLIPRSLHKAAAAFCQAHHGQRLTDYILSQPAKEFSEFNALGALAYYRARDQFSWLDTTKEPLPELVAIQKWSHDPFTEADKAEFEQILSGDVSTVVSAGDESKSLEESAGRTAFPTLREDSPSPAQNPNIKQTPQGFWVLVRDSHISRWCEEHGSLFHDHQVLPKILPEIPVGGTVIDIGANIGDTAIPFSDRVGPKGYVLAIEPHPVAYECLRRNASLFAKTTISVVNAAVGDTAGKMSLSEEENTGASFLSSKPGNVDVRTIDSFVMRECDFIKIDVEGYELRVLKGAEQTIARFHPKMLIELNEGALNRQGTNQLEVCAWLQAHGYKWWPVQGNLAPDSPQYDILCTYVGISSESPPSTNIDTIQGLAERLKNFCGTSAQTRLVRLELHRRGVIELPYRFKRRGKWRKKKVS